VHDLEDKWTRAAVLSAINLREEQFLHGFLSAATLTNRPSLPPMMEELSHIAAAAAPTGKLPALLQEMLAFKDAADLAWQMAAISGFADGLRSRDLAAKNRSVLMGL